VRDYLFPCRKYALDESFINFMASFVTGKFALMTPKEVWRLGYFYENEGRFYSNEGYKPRITTTYCSNARKPIGGDDKKDDKDDDKGNLKATPKKQSFQRSRGMFLACGLCYEYVNRTTMKEYEDMLICAKCQDKLKITAQSSLPNCGGYDGCMGY
jgi:hypothetical protein